MRFTSIFLFAGLVLGYFALGKSFPSEAVELKQAVIYMYIGSALVGFLWFTFPVFSGVIFSVLAFVAAQKIGLSVGTSLLVCIPGLVSLCMHLITESKLGQRIFFLREWSWRQLVLIPVDLTCSMALLAVSLSYFSLWGIYQKSTQVSEKQMEQRRQELLKGYSLRVYSPGSTKPQVLTTAKVDRSAFYQLSDKDYFNSTIVKVYHFSEGEITRKMKNYEVQDRVGKFEHWFWHNWPQGLGSLNCRPFAVKGFLNMIRSGGKRGGSNPTLQLAKNFFHLTRKLQKTTLTGWKKKLLLAQKKFLEEFPRAMYLCRKYSAVEVSKLYALTIASGKADYYGLHRLVFNLFGQTDLRKVSLREALITVASIPNPYQRTPRNFDKWKKLVLHLGKRYAKVHGFAGTPFSGVKDPHLRLKPGKWSRLLGSTKDNRPQRYHFKTLVLGNLKSNSQKLPNNATLRSVHVTMPGPLRKALDQQMVTLNSQFRQDGVGVTLQIVKNSLPRRLPYDASFSGKWSTMYSFGARYIGKGSQRKVNDFSGFSSTSGSTMKILLFLLARALWGEKLEKLLLPNHVAEGKKALIPYQLTKKKVLSIGNSHSMEPYMTPKQAIARSANVSSVLLLTQLLWGTRLIDNDDKFTPVGKYAFDLYLADLRRRYRSKLISDSSLRGKFYQYLADMNDMSKEKSERVQALKGLLSKFASPIYRQMFKAGGWEKLAQVECTKVDNLSGFVTATDEGLRKDLSNWFFAVKDTQHAVVEENHQQIKEMITKGQDAVFEPMRLVFCIKPFRQYLSILLFRDFLIKLGVHRFTDQVKQLAPVAGLVLGAGLNLRTRDLLRVPMLIQSNRFMHKVYSWTHATIGTKEYKATFELVGKQKAYLSKLQWADALRFIRPAMHQTLFGEKGTARRAGKVLAKAKLCTSDTPQACGAKTGTMQAYRGVACIMHVGQYAGVIRVYHARNKSLLRRGFEYSRRRCWGRRRRRRCKTRVRRKKFSSSDACYYLATTLVQVAKYCTSNKAHCQ